MPAIALLRFALRLLLRHLRGGELSLLGAALVLAVAGMTGVGFLGDRITGALEREANQLLGGDLLLTADHPWRPEFVQEAGRRGLLYAHSELFFSMAAKGEDLRLSAIKAVGPGYPLRGALQVSSGASRPAAPAREIPRTGTVWPDERLAAELGASPGDRMVLGESRFTVAGILSFEADRGGNFLSLAPRLVMNSADLAATGLIRAGSRVTYRLHFAGEADAVREFAAWARGRLGRGEKLEDVGQARPETRANLEKAERFLRLAALLSVVLAAVAVGLAARRFMARNLDGCAVMRCLGAGESQILLLFLMEFLIFGLVAALAGSGLGFLVQAGLTAFLSGLLALPLPAPSWIPAAQGVVLALCLLVGFVLPWLLRLGRVSTLRVLRREWRGGEPGDLAAWALGALVLAGLMAWIAGEARLAAVLCMGLVLVLALFGVLAWGMLGGLVRLGRRMGSGGCGWRLGLAALSRRRGGLSVQAVALGLGLMALLLLVLARDDLLASWRAGLPKDAPNRFVINIQADEREAVRAFFGRAGLSAPELLPMVRGRLAAVNGRAVRGEEFPEGRARQLAEREFNLSWATVPPPGNVISAGRWFDRDTGGFSVEQGLAETLGLKMGDEVAFDIGGRRVSGTITSLRKLEWDSMRVNFFVITSPGVLDGYPASYIASFRLGQGRKGFGRELAAAFPGVTLVDVSALLDQLQSMLRQWGRAVQAVFFFSIVGGVLVLWAALEASVEERAAEAALLSALGARRRQLRQGLVTEYAVLGLVAGALAVLGAGALGWALARYAFHMAYVPNLAWLAGGVVLSVFGTALFGYFMLSRSLNRPVLSVLREA